MTTRRFTWQDQAINTLRAENDRIQRRIVECQERNQIEALTELLHTKLAIARALRAVSE